MALRLVLAMFCALVALPEGMAQRQILLFEQEEAGAATRASLTERFHRHYQEAQRRLVAVLGEVPEEVFQPLPLLNAVVVHGRPELSEALARQPGVGAVLDDIEVQIGDGGTSLEQESESGREAWNLEAIGVAEVRRRYGLTGKGGRVGVLDTGVNRSHPQLKGKLELFHDFSAHRRRKVNDTDGHGSHVCGIIAGDRFGVAPGVSLIVANVIDEPEVLTLNPLKILNPFTLPERLRRVRDIVKGRSFLTVVAAALDWMADPDGDPETRDGATVINCSFTIPLSSRSSEERRLTYELLMDRVGKGLLERGVALVKSAGNDGLEGPGSITFPGNSPHFLTVGSVAADGERAGSSSFGSPDDEVLKPDLMAPGADIVSCDRRGKGAVEMSGTSMAAPHVTAAIALLQEAAPELPPQALYEVLRSTAKDLGAEGPDHENGHGLLDVPAAVAAVLEGKDPGGSR